MQWTEQMHRKQRSSMASKITWCVQHREGWCAVLGTARPVESATNVPTRCGHFVVMPFGIKRRVPNCPECRANRSSHASTAPEGKLVFQK